MCHLQKGIDFIYFLYAFNMLDILILFSDDIFHRKNPTTPPHPPLLIKIPCLVLAFISSPIDLPNGLLVCPSGILNSNSSNNVAIINFISSAAYQRPGHVKRPLPQARLPGPVLVKSFSGRELDGEEEVEERLRQQSGMKE